VTAEVPWPQVEFAMQFRIAELQSLAKPLATMTLWMQSTYAEWLVNELQAHWLSNWDCKEHRTALQSTGAVVVVVVVVVDVVVELGVDVVVDVVGEVVVEPVVDVVVEVVVELVVDVVVEWVVGVVVDEGGGQGFGEQEPAPTLTPLSALHSATLTTMQLVKPPVGACTQH
jgi:hypothetical protein